MCSATATAVLLLKRGDVCVCVCLCLCERESLFVAGGQNSMCGYRNYKKQMSSVSHNDRMNSQAEVAAREQKHMVVQRIIKILLLVPQSPSETKVST